MGVRNPDHRDGGASRPHGIIMFPRGDYTLVHYGVNLKRYYLQWRTQPLPLIPLMASPFRGLTRLWRSATVKNPDFNVFHTGTNDQPAGPAPQPSPQTATFLIRPHYARGGGFGVLAQSSVSVLLCPNRKKLCTTIFFSRKKNMRPIQLFSGIFLPTPILCIKAARRGLSLSIHQ